MQRCRNRKFYFVSLFFFHAFVGRRENRSKVLFKGEGKVNNKWRGGKTEQIEFTRTSEWKCQHGFPEFCVLHRSRTESQSSLSWRKWSSDETIVTFRTRWCNFCRKIHEYKDLLRSSLLNKVFFCFVWKISLDLFSKCKQWLWRVDKWHILMIRLCYDKVHLFWLQRESFFYYVKCCTIDWKVWGNCIGKLEAVVHTFQCFKWLRKLSKIINKNFFFFTIDKYPGTNSKLQLDNLKINKRNKISTEPHRGSELVSCRNKSLWDTEKKTLCL